MKGMYVSTDNAVMDHDLAIYDNVIYFNDSCIVKGWQKMNGPTKVYQLDPDCPDDLRADGVEYNPVDSPNESNGLPYGPIVIDEYGPVDPNLFDDLELPF